MPAGLFIRELFVLAALITRFYRACGVGYVNSVCACGFNSRNNTFLFFLVLILKFFLVLGQRPFATSEGSDPEA